MRLLYQFQLHSSLTVVQQLQIDMWPEIGEDEIINQSPYRVYVDQLNGLSQMAVA